MKLQVKVIPVFIQTLILLSCISCGKQSQSISLEDENFLAALIEAGVDRNGDGEISVREAEKTQSLYLWPHNIHDLSGLEAFINLDSLSIILNPLDSINLDGNPSIRFLELQGCQLRNLDLSSLINLTYLDCSSGLTSKNYLEQLDLAANIELRTLLCNENQLIELDLSMNILLENLNCGYNKLTELDLRANTELLSAAINNNLLEEMDFSSNLELERLISCGNNFTSLDISGNTALQKIGIDNMPELEKVCVWTLPFPPDDVSILMGFSPNVVFVLDCL